GGALAWPPSAHQDRNHARTRRRARRAESCVSGFTQDRMRHPDARAILAAFRGASSRRALRAAVRVRRTQGRCACDGFPACRIGPFGAQFLPRREACEQTEVLLKKTASGSSLAALDDSL